MVEHISQSRSDFFDRNVPDDVLASLVASQKDDFDNGVFETIATGNRKRLLAEFKRTRVFKERYLQLINAVSLPRNEGDFEKIRDKFSGVIFQEMAFLYLSGSQPDSLTLLSHKRTLEFYSWLYPKHSKVHHPFGNDSLRGISVPDGVLVTKDERVAAVCEYTLHGSVPSYQESKIEALKIHTKDFGDIFGEAKLMVVVPSGFKNWRRGVGVVETPFTHAQFRDFIDGIYGNYRLDTESATVDEIQEWTWEQRRKIEAQHSLTPQARKYLQKVSAQGR